MSPISKLEHDADVASARVAGAAEERARITSIINCPEAAGREATAAKLAITPGMTAVAAAAILKNSVGADASADFQRGQQIAKSFGA